MVGKDWQGEAKGREVTSRDSGTGGVGNALAPPADLAELPFGLVCLRRSDVFQPRAEDRITYRNAVCKPEAEGIVRGETT